MTHYTIENKHDVIGASDKLKISQILRFSDFQILRFSDSQILKHYSFQNTDSCKTSLNIP